MEGQGISSKGWSWGTYKRTGVPSPAMPGSPSSPPPPQSMPRYSTSEPYEVTRSQKHFLAALEKEKRWIGLRAHCLQGTVHWVVMVIAPLIKYVLGTWRKRCFALTYLQELLGNPQVSFWVREIYKWVPVIWASHEIKGGKIKAFLAAGMKWVLASTPRLFSKFQPQKAVRLCLLGVQSLDTWFRCVLVTNRTSDLGLDREHRG